MFRNSKTYNVGIIFLKILNLAFLFCFVFIKLKFNLTTYYKDNFLFYNIVMHIQQR